jgi:hypothetical protein
VDHVSQCFLCQQVASDSVGRNRTTHDTSELLACRCNQFLWGTELPETWWSVAFDYESPGTDSVPITRPSAIASAQLSAHTDAARRVLV